LVECFFNRIKRFRRIALRCEKTVSSFKAFVDIACVMACIS
jgi:transposase